MKVGPLKLTVDGGILLGTSYMREAYGARSHALYGDQGAAYRGVLSTSAAIEVGKLADLVVLSDDLLTCPEERMRGIRADLTIVNGAVAFQR